MRNYSKALSFYEHAYFLPFFKMYDKASNLLKRNYTQPRYMMYYIVQIKNTYDWKVLLEIEF